ncbi:hypothetical protein [Methanobrevibacter sp.]
MVKYLLSSFSSNMVAEPQYNAEHTELTEDEFNEQRVGAVAVIRNPAFARLLHVPVCKKFIQMREGDVALVVGTDGGKLKYNASCLPPELSLTFEKVEIKGVTV